MKNITISIPDDLYIYVRICALRRDTSVSAMVRKFFESLLRVEEPDSYPADWDSSLGSAPDDGSGENDAPSPPVNRETMKGRQRTHPPFFCESTKLWPA